MQEADPSGELECCVGNIDILDVIKLPAYFDGALQIINQDEEGNIISAKCTKLGHKVSLYARSIDDIMFEYNLNDLPVTFEGFSEESEKSYRQSIDKDREEHIKINNDIEQSHFNQWVEKKLGDKSNDMTEWISNRFAQKNIFASDPLPDDLKTKVNKSWAERREIQWEREIEFHWDDYKLTLRKKDV